LSKRNGHNPASIRIDNQKLVLEIIRNSKNITVTQIAEKIQLSKTTLWKIIDRFLEQNLILNIGKANCPDDRGKKPELYCFNESYGYVISIALYGYLIILALTDAKANIFYMEKVSLHENEPLDKVIRIISTFIAKWQEPENLLDHWKKSKLLGIVIAATGVIDYRTGVCFTASRFNNWPPETRIKDLIQQEVELKAPFYIDNYNRFFAYAERTLGRGGNKNIIVIVQSHDGLGAGIIEEGKIKRGPRFLAGEIGHICLNPFYSEPCHCGGHGCFEQLVSTELLLKKAISGRNEHPESMIYSRNKSSVNLQDIFDSADKDDSWAQELLHDLITWFSIGFQNILLVFNPEVFIISGDYRNAGKYFKERLLSSMESRSIVRMKKCVSIEYSQFDEVGAILGGACYVLDDFFHNNHAY